jgi:hypothetical protein
MKINKIFLLATMALVSMGIASCSSDDDYAPGKPAGSNDVYFTNEASQAIELSATSFTITLGRADAGSAISVPLVQRQVASVFTVPATAEFAAGQTETEVTIQVSSEAEPFTDYQLRLAIPEEYTSPYKAGDPKMVPELNIFVHKEDYVLYATGTFNENVLFGNSWEQTIEYSATLDVFRMPDVFASGTNWYFLWNEKSGDDCEFSWCNASGKAVSKFDTGYVHSSYGMIAANDISDDKTFVGYNADDNAFYFPLEFTVSAGSFGSDFDTLTDVKFVK